MAEKSVSDKLSELFDLHKSGALTKEEYERLKKRILSETGVNLVENEKKQEPDVSKSSDNSIQTKKASRIWILAITGLVIIVVAFLVIKSNLFSSKSGSTAQKAQIMKDIDGNVYKTVTIGAQVWMAENLKTTKYSDGTTIPLITDEKAWEALNTAAYIWYNNDETANKNTCGALYNWYAVNTNKLCPAGWHVSTNEEWITLMTYLGGEDVAGGKLKEAGTIHWQSPNTGATNETGFTALPGGYLHHLGTFKGMGSFDFWWTASEYDATHAWNTNVSYNHSKVNRNNYMFQNGLSVRCLQDLSTSKNNIPFNSNSVVENNTAVWDSVSAIKIIMAELNKCTDWSTALNPANYEVDYSKDLHHTFWRFQKIVLAKKELIVGMTISRLENNCPPICDAVFSAFEFENRKGWRLTQKAIGFSRLTSEGLVGFHNNSPDNYEISIKDRLGNNRSGFCKYLSLYTFINEKLTPIFTWQRCEENDTIYFAKIRRPLQKGDYHIMLEEKAKPENGDTIVIRTIYTFNGSKYEKFNGTITDPSLTSTSRFFDINTMEQRGNNVCPTCGGTGIQVCPLCGATGVDNMGMECGCIRTYKMELTAGHTPSHPPLKWTCPVCGGTGKSSN